MSMDHDHAHEDGEAVVAQGPRDDVLRSMAVGQR